MIGKSFFVRQMKIRIIHGPSSSEFRKKPPPAWELDFVPQLFRLHTANLISSKIHIPSGWCQHQGPDVLHQNRSLLREYLEAWRDKWSSNAFHRILPPDFQKDPSQLSHPSQYQSDILYIKCRWPRFYSVSDLIRNSFFTDSAHIFCIIFCISHLP